MRTPCSRRRFLLSSAAAAGALAARPDGLLAAPAAAGSRGEMAIARWTGAADLSPQQMQQAAVKLTEKCVEGIGGLGRFVRRGDVVWVKANIAWDRTPEQAANTNPDVVATVVRLCFEAGAKTVKVGDYSVHIAQKTYETSGIAAAARGAGAEVLFVDPTRFRETAIGGERIKNIPIYPEMIEADLMINLPIAKHHCLSTATLGMKNYMGVVDNRKVFHQDLPTCIADITRFMKPRICILDAMRVLKAHGPTGGNLEDVETKLTVAASTDIVALDALGAELLSMKPADIGSIVKGHEVKLGTMDYRSLTPKEIGVS